MLVPKGRDGDTRCGWPRLYSVHHLPCQQSEDEEGIEMKRFRRRKANVEFKAAAEKCTESYRKQQKLQVDTLKTIRAG